MVENFDEFDKWLAIRQSFTCQTFVNDSFVKDFPSQTFALYSYVVTVTVQVKTFYVEHQ